MRRRGFSSQAAHNLAAADATPFPSRRYGHKLLPDTGERAYSGTPARRRMLAEAWILHRRGAPRPSATGRRGVHEQAWILALDDLFDGLGGSDHPGLANP
jgi:hypothetical protein